MTELTRLKRFGEKQTFMTRFIITSYIRLMKFEPKAYLPQLNWYISIISTTETRSHVINKVTEDGVYSNDGKFIPYANIIFVGVYEEYYLTNYSDPITISSKCYLNRAKKGCEYVRSMFIGSSQYGVSNTGPENYCDPFLSYYHLSTLLGHLNKLTFVGLIRYKLSHVSGILSVLVYDRNDKSHNVIITPDAIKTKLLISTKNCTGLYTGSQAAKLIDEIFNS